MFYYALLAVIQGFTEFLPISSSGHLVIAKEFSKSFLSEAFPYAVALHIGTAGRVNGLC